MLIKRLQILFLLILGIIFVISGLGKILDTAAFANVIYSYGVGYLSLLAPAIAVLEIYLGLSLLLGYKTRLHSILIFFLVAGFSCIYTYGLITDGIEDCHCFGTLSFAFLESPVAFYIKNSLLILLSSFIWKFPVHYSIFNKKLRNVLMIMILVISTFIAGYTFSIPGQLKISPRTQYKMTDTRAKLLMECYPFNCDSTYVVFVFSYKCPYCINSIEHIKVFEERGIVDKAIFIGHGYPSKREEFIAGHDLQNGIIEMKPEWINRMIDEFPTTFFIKDCKPIFALPRYVESPVMYMKRHKQLRDHLTPEAQAGPDVK